MKYNRKLDAFTLSEMIVVMILTTIVVGLAFSVLTLVQKHMNGIQSNFTFQTELSKLEQSLVLNFNRFSKIEFDDKQQALVFSSEVETRTYHFHQDAIVKELDTFPIQKFTKEFFFAGNMVNQGKVDAIKLTTSAETQNKVIFVFRENDAAIFME